MVNIPTNLKQNPKVSGPSLRRCLHGMGFFILITSLAWSATGAGLGLNSNLTGFKGRASRGTPGSIRPVVLPAAERQNSPAGRGWRRLLRAPAPQDGTGQTNTDLTTDKDKELARKGRMAAMVNRGHRWWSGFLATILGAQLG